MKLPNTEVQEFIYNSNKIENYDYVVHLNMDSLYVKNHIEAFKHICLLAKLKGDIKPIDIEQTHDILMKGLLHKDNCGKFRTCKIYVSSHEKDPWIHLPELVKQLCNYINKGPGKEDVEEWCWFIHDEFECIHPFVDGNGRTGRLLLNLLRFKHKLPIKIVKYEDRWEYYGNIMEYEKVREKHGYKK